MRNRRNISGNLKTIQSNQRDFFIQGLRSMGITETPEGRPIGSMPYHELLHLTTIERIKRDHEQENEVPNEQVL
ncbi:hypothetical protein [Paenisporosarcina cavernae]|uniref:hypothetical protein n=1 Tax=Paenisporosarcina cavernae TaxID=2320858 RepID=UPI0013C42193|nr:hypothetical protein [Paenisporosarcina cavernae]